MLSKPTPPIKAYLAGPDVFLPDPVGIGKKKKELLKRYNIEGYYPFDNEYPQTDDSTQVPFLIAKANEDMMSKCNVILANLMPWYGAAADNGTTFEMGFMSARAMTDPNILIIGYYPDGIPEQLATRVTKVVYDGKVITKDGSIVSTETGRTVENFQLTDNLMIIGAIKKSGGEIYGSFKEAAAHVRELFEAKQQRQSVPKEGLFFSGALTWNLAAAVEEDRLSRKFDFFV